MLHKYSKFISILERNPKTLFIRMGGHHDTAVAAPYALDDRATTTEDLNALCSSLDGRFRDLTFGIAFVTARGVTPLDIDSSRLDQRVHLFEIEHYDSNDFAGYTSAWAPIFDAFRIKIRDDIEHSRLTIGENRDKEVMF